MTEIYTPRTSEAEAGGSWVQGQLELHDDFKTLSAIILIIMIITERDGSNENKAIA